MNRTSGLSREENKRRKRERAEARNNLYRLMKPLQENYMRLEKDLEAVFEAQGRVEALLADSTIYVDSGRATELLKEFHLLQGRGEDLLEKLAKAEAALVPYEAQKTELDDSEG